MITREDAAALVRRMQECFNSREFDEADDLYAADFFTHPLGTGFEAGKDAWRELVALLPGVRVVADEILVDGDKVTVRSSVAGTGAQDSAAQPTLIEVFRVEDGRFAEWWGSTWLPGLR